MKTLLKTLAIAAALVATLVPAKAADELSAQITRFELDGKNRYNVLLVVTNSGNKQYGDTFWSCAFRGDNDELVGEHLYVVRNILPNSETPLSDYARSFAPIKTSQSVLRANDNAPIQNPRDCGRPGRGRRAAKAQDAKALEAAFTVVYYDWLCSPQIPLSLEARNALAFVTSFASKEANDAAEARVKQTYATLGRGRFCAAMAPKADADIAELNGGGTK
jgi:hypothetical protein